VRALAKCDKIPEGEFENVPARFFFAKAGTPDPVPDEYISKGAALMKKEES
jgi:hypothetical protein